MTDMPDEPDLIAPARIEARSYIATEEGKVAAVIEIRTTWTTADGVPHVMGAAYTVRDALQLAKHIADVANEAHQAAKARARHDDSRN